VKKSSSAVSQETTTIQRDERVAATDQAVVVQLSEGSSLTLTDPGIVDAAQFAFESFEQFQAGALEEVLGFAEERAEAAFELVSETVGRAFEVSKPEGQAGFERIARLGALTVVAIAAIKGLDALGG